MKAGGANGRSADSWLSAEDGWPQMEPKLTLKVWQILFPFRQTLASSEACLSAATVVDYYQYVKPSPLSNSSHASAFFSTLMRPQEK